MSFWARSKPADPEIDSAENRNETAGPQQKQRLASHNDGSLAAGASLPLRESHATVSSRSRTIGTKMKSNTASSSDKKQSVISDTVSPAPATTKNESKPKGRSSSKSITASLRTSSSKATRSSSASTSQAVMATTSTTSSAASVMSWTDSLYRACIAHQTFSLTPTQVLMKQQQVLRPRLGSAIVYHQDNVPMTAKAVVEDLRRSSARVAQQSSLLSAANVNSNGSNTVTTLAKRFVTSVAWVGSKVIQTVVGDEYDEEDLTYSEEADDVDESNDKAVPWNAPIVCVPLVGKTMDQLIPHCHDMGKVALCRQGTGEYSFAGWLASTCPATFSKNIKAADVDLLANVLVCAGHAVFHDDYLVFDPSATATDLQVAASLAQLKQAIRDTENRLEEWTRLEDAYTRNATRKKQKGDNKGAIHELEKRKLLRNKMDVARASLLNLQQTHDTLDASSLRQTQLIQPLEAASRALKALREECPVERVDEIALDLQEELEQASTMPETSQFVGQQDFDEVGDKELLDELNRLTLKDDDAKESKEKKNSASAEGSSGSKESERNASIAPLEDRNFPSVPKRIPGSKRDNTATSAT